MFNFSKKSASSSKVVTFAAPAVVVLTTMEKLVAKRQAELRRRAEEDAAFAAEEARLAQIETETLAMLEKAKAEESALQAVATEIRLATAAANEATTRAQNAREVNDYIQIEAANKIAEVNNYVEDLSKSLLEEFGC